MFVGVLQAKRPLADDFACVGDWQWAQFVHSRRLGHDIFGGGYGFATRRLVCKGIVRSRAAEVA
jgi:hypothetical protein